MLCADVKLSKLLSEGFKRPVYWNKYKVILNRIVEVAAQNAKHQIRELLDSSYKVVKRLLVLAYNNKASNIQVSVDLNKKCFF